jgi:hypothetical protein
MRESLNPLFKFLPPGLLTTSGTESWLRADAQGVMVFAAPSGLFHRDPKLTSLTRTGKNHATATRTATKLNRRAVIKNTS